MPDENVTTKFKVDISELKAGVSAANKQIKLANAEFNAATAGIENWGDSIEGLQAKLKQLETVIEAETSKLNSYQQQLKKVEEAEAENAKRADQLRAAYEQAVQQYGKNSEEAKKLKTALNAVEKEQTSNAKAADDLRIKILNQTGVVNKAQKEHRQFSGALEELEDNSQDAKKKLEQLRKQADDLSDGFTVAKGALADFISSGLKNLISMAADGVKSLLSLGDETREYRTEMAKVNTAFEDAGHTAEVAAATYQDFYGVLGDEGQATEAVSHLAKLTSSQKELSEWTTICTGVYATFGDSLPIEALTEAANETAKTGELTGALADALNWAGVSEDSFKKKLEKCNTEAEREALIRETLNELYSEAGEKYAETTKDITDAREAQGRLTDKVAQFGKKIEPIMTVAKNGFADLLDAIGGLLTDADWDGIKNMIAGAFDWFINVGLPAIQNGIKWIMDNKDALITAIVAIGAAFVAWKIVSIITSAVTAIQTMGGAFQALNLILKANVIGIVVSAIAALVAAFIYLWNNCEEFRQFWYDLWDGIVAAFNATVEWLKGAAASIGEFFVSAWETIKTAWGVVVDWFNGIWKGITKIFSVVTSWFSKIFSSAWAAIKNAFSPFIGYFEQLWNTLVGIFSVVKSVLSGNFSDAWQAIKNVFSGWGKYFSGLWEDVKSAFSNATSGMSEIGKNIVEGLWNGINGMVSWLTSKISGFCSSALGAIKNFFGIASPSKLMAKEVGRWIPPGIAEGITDNIAVVKNAMHGVVDVSKSALNGVSLPSATSPSSGNQVVFNQYNNSPEPLSRLEIYRQTQNQLRMLKGWA